jgi:hypothetical protein
MIVPKRFTDLSKSEQRSYHRMQGMGFEFEVSSNGCFWTDKQPRVPFWANDYYRIKGETSMGGEMKWKYLNSSTQHYYQHQLNSGVQFEISNDGVYWVNKNPGTTFHSSHYYRIKKGAPAMNPDVKVFCKLDPTEQGAILLAQHVGDKNLQRWSYNEQAWVTAGQDIYDDQQYRFKPTPRECYVKFDKDGYPVETAFYEFDCGLVLMREVMEGEAE